MQCSPTWHVLSSSPVTRASQTPNGIIFSVEHPGTSEEYWWKSIYAVSLRMIDLTGGSLNDDQSGEVMETSRPNKITLGSYPRRSFSKGINTIKHALETHVLRPPTPPRGMPKQFPMPTSRYIFTYIYSKKNTPFYGKQLDGIDRNI